MKSKIILSIMGWLITNLITPNTYAQVVQKVVEEASIERTETPKNKLETQEIIIRKKGDKDSKFTMEITGSKVLINGKPIAEFSEDGLTINNRKIIIKEGNKITVDFNGDTFNGLDNPENIKEIQIDRLPDDRFFGNGETTKTYLGVTTEKDAAGAKITFVEKDSPADKAGLQKDDVIYKIDKEDVINYSDLSSIISSKKADDVITIYFVRFGKQKNIKATLKTKTNKFGINKIYEFNMPDGKQRRLTIPRGPLDNKAEFYFDDDNINSVFIDTRKPKLGIKIQDTEEGNGVKVLEVEEGSLSQKAGIKVNDIIINIADAATTNTDVAREQLKQNKEKQTYTIKAKRDGKEMNFNIVIPKKLKTVNL